MNNLNSFCDGGAYHNGHPDCITSIGVYAPKLNYKYSGIVRDEELNTIERGELFAIIHSLEFGISKKFETITIFTDSQVSQKCILGIWKITKNFDLYNRIDELLKKFIMAKIFWIKSHDGNIGNEIANDLATKALSNLLGDKYTH